MLAAASPARCLLAPHAATRTQTRRNLATTPDEISHAAHYNAYDYNAESQSASEDDWRSMATAAGAMEEDPAEKWAGLFTPWDASQEQVEEDFVDALARVRRRTRVAKVVAGFIMEVLGPERRRKS